MAVRPSPLRFANQSNESIARFLGRRRRTGLVGTAGAIDLAGGNPGKPDARTFSTPDGTIAIPDMYWRTGKVLTGWNNKDSREENVHSK